MSNTPKARLILPDGLASAPEIPDLPHVYAIAPRVDGRWGTWCYACSEAKGDYVYPCKEGADLPGPTPAEILVPADAAELALSTLAAVAELLGLYDPAAEEGTAPPVTADDILAAIKDLPQKPGYQI